MRKKIGAPQTISQAVRIAKIVDFLPNKLDAGFQIWAKKGLITINQMSDGETLKSFKQLQDKYRLCSKDFYRYLQLRDYPHQKQRFETTTTTFRTFSGKM